MCTIKYLLQEVITDTHKAIMATPACRGCGRNVMDEGISVGFIQVSFLRPLMCIFRVVLPFILTFARLVYLLPISTVISALISSLLLLQILKTRPPELKHLWLISVSLYSSAG